MNEDFRIEFIKRLINESPETSLLKINGFYSEFISFDSFRKLFPTVTKSDRNKIVNYIIPLNKEIKKILISIIEIEGEQLINDMTHFCIENNDEAIFISHDGMEFMQIVSNRFPKLEKIIEKEYKSLETEIIPGEINNDFFKDIIMPTPNKSYDDNVS